LRYALPLYGFAACGISASLRLAPCQLVKVSLIIKLICAENAFLTLYLS
jgi:hypothetical protein